MGIINQLNVEVSNKIAAGEVVERPASAVKELVENAIDAGSTQIAIEIKKGGVTYIRVTDNGAGIDRDDAKIAFLRHATSKIKDADDLDAIYTMGFRGEALSSIGAVSQVELFTKRPEDEIGTHVVFHGGKLISCEDAGVPNGSSFVIHNLFYNTPARMNFLKKDSVEAGAITDIIERFILAHPEISFRYTIDGKEKYFTSGDGNLINSVYAVYGKNIASSMIPVEYETELLKITGVIGKGDVARPNRTYQSFFVNRRYIKSARFSNTLAVAYKNQIMIGKHPMAILNLEINPRHIDINVHPTKLEVKFSHENEVFDAIYHAVKNALYAIPNVPQIERPISQKTEFVRDSITTKEQISIPKEPAFDAVIEEKPKTTYIETSKTDTLTSYALDTSAEYFRNKRSIAASTESVITPPEKVAESTVSVEINALSHRKEEETIAELLDKATYGTLEKSEAPSYDAPDTAKSEAIETAKEDVTETIKVEDAITHENPWGFSRDNVRVIGQLFDTYILAESGDTMILADQHAAHERLKYEELLRELKARKVTSQMLLVPVSLDLSPTEYATYLENQEKLSEMGFEIESFGTNSLVIRATPEALPEDELKALVLELITKLGDGAGDVVSGKMERLLYTIACKAAVKANHSFAGKQLENLLFAVLDLENINTCPHGRPIIVTMTKKELEKEFKRIV